MALVVADRVQETTNTTGTSDYALLGAAAGYQSFGAVLANADTTYYAITNDTDWEVGIGTYSTTGPTLARTTILASSNGGSVVNWGVGVKNIFISYAASKSVYLDASGNLSVDGTTLFVDATNDRVGIGTSSPATALDVTGDIRLTGSTPAIIFAENDTTDIDGRLRLQGGDLLFETVTDANVLVRENMRITDAGNVGIGTTAPTLNSAGTVTHINASGSDAAAVHLTNGTTGSAANDGMILGRWNDGNNYLWVYENEPLYLGTNNTQRAAITEAGHVGIGTSSPSYKFVVSDAGNEGLEIDPVSTASQVRLISYDRVAAGYTGLNSLASEHIWSIGSTAKMQLNASGALGVGGANYGTSGQVLTSAGSGAAPTWSNLSSAQVGSATAGLAWGAVGTYAYLGTISTISASTTLAIPGGTVAGSSLQAVGPYALEGTPGYSRRGVALSGTWRAMGYAHNLSASARLVGTLFLRIS